MSPTVDTCTAEEDELLHARQVGRLDDELEALRAKRARLLRAHKQHVGLVSLQVDPQYELMHAYLSGCPPSKEVLLELHQSTHG